MIILMFVCRDVSFENRQSTPIVSIPADNLPVQSKIIIGTGIGSFPKSRFIFSFRQIDETVFVFFRKISFWNRTLIPTANTGYPFRYRIPTTYVL